MDTPFSRTMASLRSASRRWYSASPRVAAGAALGNAVSDHTRRGSPSVRLPAAPPAGSPLAVAAPAAPPAPSPPASPSASRSRPLEDWMRRLRSVSAATVLRLPFRSSKADR